MHVWSLRRIQFESIFLSSEMINISQVIIIIIIIIISSSNARIGRSSSCISRFRFCLLIFNFFEKLFFQLIKMAIRFFLFIFSDRT